MSANCERVAGRGKPATFGGVESVGGARTAKFTEELPDRVVTQWLALDYNCVSVQRAYDWRGQGTSRTDLVSFTPGEPNGALFDLPSDFQEGPPSTLHFPDTKISPSIQKMFEARDRDYFSRRQR